MFDPQGISAEWPSQFSKKISLAQNVGYFEFLNFLSLGFEPHFMVRLPPVLLNTWREINTVAVFLLMGTYIGFPKLFSLLCKFD